MALEQSALLELVESLSTADEGTLMRRLLATILQQLIDAEASAVVGAGRYERSPARTTQRNGTRSKLVSTTSGDVEVAIPKLRQGSFFPSLLAPRRRIDVALHAVVMEAFVHGVSTRKVDDLVTALGVEAGISNLVHTVQMRRRTLLAAAASAAAAALTGTTAWALTGPAPAAARWLPGTPALIAHRGRAGSDPENTLAGLAGLAGLPWVAGVEIDVQLTSDGVPILMHDRRLDRTTGVDAAVGDLTAAEVTGLDAGGDAVPTLAEALATIATMPALRQVLVDIKDGNPAVVAAATTVADRAGLADRCTIMVRPGQAEGARSATHLRLGSFRATTDNVGEVVADMQRHGGRLILTAPEAYVPNRQIVPTVRAAGLQVGASTTNDLDSLQAARDDGVDLVLTDIADQLGWWHTA